jgi:hypothetical protein
MPSLQFNTNLMVMTLFLILTWINTVFCICQLLLKGLLYLQFCGWWHHCYYRIVGFFNCIEETWWVLIINFCEINRDL